MGHLILISKRWVQQWIVLGSFIRLASSMQMAHSVILFGLVSVILMVKVVSLHI